MNWTNDEQKEHRRLWVEALRSGEYEQARGQLRSASGFCCLGVACDISGLGEWHADGVGFEYVTPGCKSVASLQPELCSWFGLQTSNGGWGGYLIPTESLASKNDYGASFAEIADIIESEFEGLFVESEQG